MTKHWIVGDKAATLSFCENALQWTLDQDRFLGNKTACSFIMFLPTCFYLFGHKAQLDWGYITFSRLQTCLNSEIGISSPQFTPEPFTEPGGALLCVQSRISQSETSQFFAWQLCQNSKFCWEFFGCHRKMWYTHESNVKPAQFVP